MTLTPGQIVVMTAEQLQSFAEDVVRQTLDAIADGPKPAKAEDPTEYRYGIRAIEEMFGVCHSTAQDYKNTFLKPAIEQRGRKIRVDVALAHKLYAEARQTDK